MGGEPERLLRHARSKTPGSPRRRSTSHSILALNVKSFHLPSFGQNDMSDYCATKG